MKNPIISHSEALQILKNDLRKRALEKHVAALNNADPVKRAKLLARIERELDKEIKRRSRRLGGRSFCIN